MTPTGPPKVLHGVGALLDPTATGRVRSLWSRLEHEFGLRGVLGMPYPHLSYQVAQHYDRGALETALERLARETSPFVIRTTGLATFEGDWPVVFVAVEKDAMLPRCTSACGIPASPMPEECLPTITRTPVPEFTR